jgi:hypothetical protein
MVRRYVRVLTPSSPGQEEPFRNWSNRATEKPSRRALAPLCMVCPPFTFTPLITNSCTLCINLPDSEVSTVRALPFSPLLSLVCSYPPCLSTCGRLVRFTISHTHPFLGRRTRPICLVDIPGLFPLRLTLPAYPLRSLEWKRHW